MPDRQSISSGDDSINVQSTGTTVVNVGLQYSDAKQLLEDLFDLNFDKLVAVARDEAARRAAELNDALLQKLKNLTPEVVANLSEPDVQRSLVQAQIEHATMGDPNDVDLLANLLVEKLEKPGKNMTSIACQLAIETVGQLTERQVDLLSCIFIVYKLGFTGVTGVTNLQTLIRSFAGSVAYAAKNDWNELRYLDSTGCIALDTTRGFNTGHIMRSNYPEIFGKTFTSDQVPKEFYDVIEHMVVQIQSGSGRLQIIPAIVKSGILDAVNPLVNDSNRLAFAAAVDLVDSCRGFNDEQTWGLLANGNADIQHMFEQFANADSETGLLRHSFLTNKGLAIAHANLRRKVGVIAALNVWIN